MQWHEMKQKNDLLKIKWFVKNKMICDYKENALCFMIY